MASVTKSKDDDIISHNALLIASTIYQRRLVNVRKRNKRNSWASEWITAQQQNENPYRFLATSIDFRNKDA